MSRRSVTPSFEASQKHHIAELIQRNTKLKDELTQEKNRAKVTIQDIQSKLHAEKREWREACDTLQICHRIHQLRLQVELEKEKSSFLSEQELLRKEKVAALQREYAITKFQAQEALLERRIEELEDEVGTLDQQLQDEKHVSKAQILELVTHLKAQQKQLEIAEREKATVQTELDNLHRTNAESQVSSGSLSVKLERATLQLDGERSKNADLERTNEELKISNEQLKRQVAKWQSLESKGDTEIELPRKKCVELEVQLQAVQSQLSKREEEDAKMQKRLEKIKQRAQEWQEYAASYQEDVEEWKQKFEKSERDIVKLVAEHETLKQAQIKHHPMDSEEEIAQAISQAYNPPSSAVVTSSRKSSSAKPASRSASRTQKAAVPSASSSTHTPPDREDDEIHEVVANTRGKGKGKAKAESDAGTETEGRRKQTRKPKAKQDVGSDSEIEAISMDNFPVGPPVGKRNGGKAKKETAEVERKGKRKATSPPAADKEQSEGRESSKVPAKRTKRNDDAEQLKPKPKPKPKGQGGKGNSAATSRSGSTASIATVEAEAGGSGSQKPPAPKKRKINVFQQPGSKMNLSDFNFGSQASGIPSVLSPLKPQDTVPARSTSFIGSWFQKH